MSRKSGGEPGGALLEGIRMSIMCQRTFPDFLGDDKRALFVDPYRTKRLVRMKNEYISLLGYAEGARKIHVHLTTLDAPIAKEGHKHSHNAEEAMYFLEGEVEYAIGKEIVKAGPGDLLFFPSNVFHGPVRFISDRLKYLVIRNIEPGDERCCCDKDRPPNTE